MVQKLLVTLLLVASSVLALEEYFPDSLSKEELLTLDTVIDSFHIGGPKGPSLREAKEEDLVGKKLYNYAAWQVSKGSYAAYAIDKLRRREDTFFPKDTFSIIPSVTQIAGDTTSPIHVVAYVTSTCPSCKKTGIPLYQLVNGPLQGRLSFALKPIHHKIGDYALLAADKQGKMWQLFIEYGNLTNRLDDKTVFTAAQKAGIDTTELKKDMTLNYETYREQIESNHIEAKNNGLTTTPTLYFNGLQYYSNRHPLWIVDYVELLEEDVKKKRETPLEEK